MKNYIDDIKGILAKARMQSYTAVNAAMVEAYWKIGERIVLQKPEGDNPTIGIILCAERSETVVKYSVLNDNPQMFAAKFMPYLPTEEELKAELDRRNIEKKLLD